MTFDDTKVIVLKEGIQIDARLLEPFPVKPTIDGRLWVFWHDIFVEFSSTKCYDFLVKLREYWMKYYFSWFNIHYHLKHHFRYVLCYIETHLYRLGLRSLSDLSSYDSTSTMYSIVRITIQQICWKRPFKMLQTKNGWNSNHVCQGLKGTCQFITPFRWNQYQFFSWNKCSLLRIFKYHVTEIQRDLCAFMIIEFKVRLWVRITFQQIFWKRSFKMPPTKMA